MRTGTKKIKINYKPLNAFKNVRILSGSIRQNYNTEKLFFEPDRRIDPLVILVECGINDPHNYVSGLINSNLTNIDWKISENAVFKNILNNNPEFEIGKNANKGQLKIFKNISDLESVTISFKAKYLEPTSKRIVNFQESFVLITNPIATAPAILQTSAPYGLNLYPTINDQGLICQADLFRGTDKLAAAYYWYKDGVEITDTNGYQNSKTNRLFVPSSAISKTGDVIKVEVADCSAYLNQPQQDSSEVETTVELPPDFRPPQKPTTLYKGEFLLLKKYPIYEHQLIGPDSINPDLDEVEYEIVLNTSDGVIQNAIDHFSIGWLKQTDGTFLYKGLKVKIPMIKLLELNNQNKALDYEIFEDLTQKP